MLLVIDTNIIVSAIKTHSKSACESKQEFTKAQKLILDVICGKHKMVVSRAIFDEYEDVLHRPRLGLDYGLVEAFLSIVRQKALWIEPLPTNQAKIEMLDEDDRIFFDVAKCMNIKLVTGNIRHYPIHELRTTLDELY